LREEGKDTILIRIFRIFKYNKFLIIIFILFCISLYVAFFGNKGFFERKKLDNENSTLQKIIYEDSLKSVELKKEIEELENSDKKIEQVAREKYKMTKPGEKIIRIKADTIK
jgi:cell division protein FtsB